MNAHRFFPLFALPLLVACTQPALGEDHHPVPSVQDPKVLWQQRKQQLDGFTHWELKGRLAVRTEGRSDSASLIWKRNGIEQEIRLFGPFGGGRVRISKSIGGAVLHDGTGQEFHGLTVEEALYRGVAWYVPFTALGYWVRGLPLPELAYRVGFDHSGRARELNQSGWNIEYLEYRKFQDLDLPYKIKIVALPGTIQAVTDDGTESGDLFSVKFIIGYWGGKPES
jgi:outer membrane lipoprotein LolB